MMNKAALLNLVKSGDLQRVGLGRTAGYQSLKSEKTRKNSEKLGINSE